MKLRVWAVALMLVPPLTTLTAVAQGTSTKPKVRAITALVRLDHADVASLAYKWHKPLSARLFPIAGGKPGDSTEVDDPYLFNAKLHALP